METFALQRGSVPLIVSLPHDGTHIPDDLVQRMLPAARRVPDTDWHVARLYGFAHELGASVITPVHSRYVIDLNRPADNASLYPGRNTTGLCPVTQFSGAPVYQAGAEPHASEIAERIRRYWQPYHAALAGEIERLRAAHGRVVLWDGHSIRAEVPFLFAGRLPDFNLGTHGGASCTAALRDRLATILAGQDAYSQVVDGRFKGGYITRHYGRPETGVEAIQLELAQSIYMDEATFTYRPERAAPVQALIRRLLECCLA